MVKYQIRRGNKYYGATTVSGNIQLEIRNTEKIATVGRSGCRKTMLLRVTAETEVLDAREIHKENRLWISYPARMTSTGENVIVEEETEQVFEQVKAVGERPGELNEKIRNDHSEAVLDVYADVQQRLEELGGYMYRSEMTTIFTKFGFQKEDLKRPISTFSGGQKTWLAFVKLLLSKSDVLLLDELTNHLDIDTTEWSEGYMKYYPKAVVPISRNRMSLDDAVDVVHEIEHSVIRRYSENYSNYVNAKKSDPEQQKSIYICQQKGVQRMEELIEKFRYKKNKAAFTQSKTKCLDRMGRIEDPKSSERSFSAHFVPNVKGRKRILEVQDSTIGYDQPLCTVNLEVMQSVKVVVIGSSEKGKSTFMKTLMRQMEPLSGSFLSGHRIGVGYFDQELARFNNVNAVLEGVWNDSPGLNRAEMRITLGYSLFTGEEVSKTVDCLSGGEEVRLSFVKLMLLHPNLLLMDEPTNHLDLIGKEALEESLEDHEGTTLFVSHDYYLINKLATATLVIDDGKVSYYSLAYEKRMNRDRAQPVEKEQQSKRKESVKPERYINYGREISELEKKIVVREEEPEAFRKLRFESEHHHDYHKMQELNGRIDPIHNEVEDLMQKQEEYSEKVGN